LKNLSIPAALLLGAALLVVGALAQRWLLAPGQTLTAAAKSAAQAAKKPTSDATAPAATAIDAETLAAVLGIVDTAQRKEILASAELFKQFAQQETLNQAVLKAATANKADENPQIKTVMERAGQRVLVEAYLNQVVRVNLDPKFPSDAQVREAYDKNPDAFRTPERIHLWQIFIPLDAGAGDKDVKVAWERANRLSADLRSGNGDFTALAKQYSGHEASRVNDGYMGLLKSAELLPPIAEALKKLKPGVVSEPIASETGLHILKRGATVAAEMLSFERVAEQLRLRMVQEANATVRQAAIEKIEKEYPFAMPSSDALESWRQDLAKQSPPALADPPPAPAAP
jgi:parvulin-like peptidyl-prolyl isomerase